MTPMSALTTPNALVHDVRPTPPAVFAAADFNAIPAIETSSPELVAAPLVSVLILTWNHEPYLAQTLESVVSQRCKFPFEIVIGEDCSTDATAAIAAEYRKRYPHLIRIVSASANVGMHRNLARIWHKARGRYIAICEGDDYWVDSDKLARQVARFDGNPRLSLCGAGTRRIEPGPDGEWRETGRIRPDVIKDNYTIEDLIAAYSFHTSSVMVRKDCVAFPRWFWDMYCADRPLYLLCAATGDVEFIPDVMSAYRLHPAGIWSPKGLLEKAAMGNRLFATIDAHFGFRYRRLIRKTVGGMYWGYVQEALATGQAAAGRTLIWMSLERLGAPLIFRHTRVWLVALARLYVPRTYARLRTVLRDRGAA